MVEMVLAASELCGSVLVSAVREEGLRVVLTRENINRQITSSMT